MIVPINTYIEPLFRNKTFYEADIVGGRGRGGSHNVTLYIFNEITKPQYFRGYLMRAVHSDIKESLWRDFNDRIEEMSDLNHYNFFKDFHLNSSEMRATHLPTGNALLSKGFKTSGGRTAKMKSMAGGTHAFIEECEEIGENEYNQMADSFRTKKAPVKIIRIWNPPSKEHWLIRDNFDLNECGVDGFYKLTKKPGNPNHLAVVGSYLDNVANLDVNTLARYQRYKETNPRYYYNQIVGLVSDGGDRKVYYNWRPMSVADFNAIDGVEAYGVDFGDVVPTSLTHIKYKDGCFYRRQLLYESMRAMNVRHSKEMEKVRANIGKLPNEDQNNIWAKHKGLLSYIFADKKVSKDIPMFCDPAQRGLIIELRQAGFRAVAAKKDKQANINFINRAVNYYTDDSYNLKAEYDVYYLDTDINKNPIDGKPKKNGEDHIMDGQEYGCRGLKDLHGIQL